jgi:peptide/nickel transport system permease protein
VLEAVGVMLLFGVPVGLVAGYRGGWVDAVVLRVTDVVLAIPVIVMLLVVLAIVGQGETVAMVTLGLLGVPGLVRVVRAATLAVRAEPYITAARVVGLSPRQIVARHLLPRAAGPIVVQGSLFAGMALITESGLAFLGLGVQEPAPSWGGMLADASNSINSDPWMLVPAGLAIGLTVLALGLIGDAVRDAIGERGAPPGRRRRPIPVRPAPVPVAGGDALLSVRGLSAVVAADAGEVPVLTDVSFDLRQGETLGIIGESGCGKTLTARAVLGLLPPTVQATAGSCRFDGRELVGASARQRRAQLGSELAFISQEPVASLDPNQRVGAQVAELVRLHLGSSRRDAARRACELLARVRLADPEAVASRYPHQISGGMAQRVAIAAALAGEPRLLIADEPTTSLDVTVQAEILQLLRELRRERELSILLITHDWGVVADSCDRALVMYAGQVVESTEAREMYHLPLHPYTDALLRANPAVAVAGDPLPAIGGAVPPPGSWPSGCRFHPRCPLATAECRGQAIAVQRPAPGRLTRCIHHDRLAAR